jgi:transcriptional regulator of met regulon
LECLNEQELRKAVSMTLNMAVLDIVGTEGTRGLLRIRKYCGDDLILEKLVEAFEEMFAYDKLDDAGKEKRRRDLTEEEDLD